MIYESVNDSASIQQGDVFRNIPRVDISLSALAVVDEDSTQRQIAWRDVVEEAGDDAVVVAMVPLKAVDAIVVTQNCDAVRGEYLCLCQIDEFLRATDNQEAPKNPKKWQSLITRHARTNQRWFYLPADSVLGFGSPMAVDFRVVIRLPRTDLEEMRDHRVGRLNSMATEHFREALGHFFRRYPYNEWYPLTREQFEAYVESCPESVKPYPWQE